MTIQYEKEKISFVISQKADNTQNIIEGDIIVPDTKPDVISIIKSDGVVTILSKECYKDMIVVRGGVELNILYQSDDATRNICNINHTINFDQTIDIKTAESQVKSKIEYKIEHLDVSIINGRKINIKAILNNNTSIEIDQEDFAVSSVLDESVQISTKKINIIKEVNSEPAITFGNWEYEIPIGKPAVKEILRNDASIADKDIKLTSGRAVIRGNLDVSSLYIPEMSESEIDFITIQIPFSEVIDIPKVEEDDNAKINVKLEKIVANIKNDEDGDSRVIEYEFSLGFYPSYLAKNQLDVIEDAYCVSSKLEIQKRSIKIPEIINIAKSQSSIKDVVHLQRNDFDKIYWIDGIANVSDISIKDKKLTVSGTIEEDITYLTSSKEMPISNVINQTPFHTEIELKDVYNSDNLNVICDIDRFSFDNINNSEIEIRSILTLNVESKSDKIFDVITEMENVETEEGFADSKASMVIYYVQPGDTLWSIAKKYYTTINQIENLNDISEVHALEVGKQILIPKVI